VQASLLALIETFASCWESSGIAQGRSLHFVRLANELPKTKRSVLKLAASVFDPLGLLSPFMISLKVLFQRLCINQVNWHESLSSDLTTEWGSIISHLEEFSKLKLPRGCIFAENYPVTVCLHSFCDASERAYAAALYFSSKYPDGHIEVRLLCRKTRVAPTVKQTIPRLELLGTLMLSRLVQSVATSLPTLSSTYLWTDLTVALYWVQNRKTWKPYAQSRVREIRLTATVGTFALES